MEKEYVKPLKIPLQMKRIQQSLLFSLLALAFTACEITSGSDSAGGESNTGKGGSMARFTICGNYLYTVDFATLKVFDISDPAKPLFLPEKTKYLDFGVETIFSLDTLLFIGSQMGMYIYNITRPDYPQQLGYVSHIRSCDPVVSDGKYAYVTLNSGDIWCGRSMNMLQIYDLSDLSNPQLVYTESDMQDPKGLGVDGKKLFVCENGLKVYDLSNPAKPVWIDDLSHIPQASGIRTYDLIPLNGLLLVIGADGLYQFDYKGEKLAFVSKINVSASN
jgi:hypothetical protein